MGHTMYILALLASPGSHGRDASSTSLRFHHAYVICPSDGVFQNLLENPIAIVYD